MINFVFGLISMFLAVILFTKIREYIANRVKMNIKKSNIKLNCSIGNIYTRDGKEKFQLQKFLKAFQLNSLTEWIKDIVSLVNLRKLIIYGLLLSAFYGRGYFQGRLNAPVKINLSYEKEWIMNLNGEELYKPKYSNDVYIRDSKTKEIIKQIKAKDMGELRKKLAPIGFTLEPIFVAGGSVGEGKNKAEVGGGISFLKYWRWKLDAFITSYPAGYIGTSYSITENSGAGIGVGKGITDGSNRVILYYRWKF